MLATTEIPRQDVVIGSVSARASNNSWLDEGEMFQVASNTLKAVAVALATRQELFDVIVDCWRRREPEGEGLESASCEDGRPSTRGMGQVPHAATPSAASWGKRRAAVRWSGFNSRLRTYFTLRRHLDNSYLDLLRFFLNHRRFMRSRCAERNGNCPERFKNHPTRSRSSRF
jgi:hypothetical protein